MKIGFNRNVKITKTWLSTKTVLSKFESYSKWKSNWTSHQFSLLRTINHKWYRCEAEIRKRTKIAKTMFNNLKSFLTCKWLNCKLNLRVIKALHLLSIFVWCWDKENDLTMQGKHCSLQNLVTWTNGKNIIARKENKDDW